MGSGFLFLLQANQGVPPLGVRGLNHLAVCKSNLYEKDNPTLIANDRIC